MFFDPGKPPQLTSRTLPNAPKYPHGAPYPIGQFMCQVFKQCGIRCAFRFIRVVGDALAESRLRK